MKHLKSFSVLGLALMTVAGCTPPKPAEPAAVPPAAEGAMPAPEVGNAVATNMVAPEAVIGNTVAADPAVNGVGAASDEPRANPDRRAPATSEGAEAPK
jgi:hypothetical protein